MKRGIYDREGHRARSMDRTIGIARALGKTPPAEVYRVRKRVPHDIINRVRNKYETGCNTRDTANDLGISIHAVKLILAHLGLEPRRQARGARVPKCGGWRNRD